ncbi:J domain-containing protein [Sphingomonas crusticola]|uniref:J domain-containing protein n=1 Tax=Sphingomonas crusticola TaxID=1697973 RepID=UPI001F07D705|nr:DnaJ domain-containing protein [Sphingomonas crusticola]
MIIELALLGVAAVAYWAWKTKDPQAIRIGDVMAVLAGLIALKLFRSNAPLAMIALGGAGWWVWFRRGGGGAGDRAMRDDEARRLLDVPADATADEIRAAHRRLVARLHPDVGGSADLTSQINAARDTLLRNRR